MPFVVAILQMHFSNCWELLDLRRGQSAAKFLLDYTSKNAYIISMVTKLQKGDKFNSLTVIGWDESRRAWKCSCDCGGETYARSWAMKTGTHKSCSCGHFALRPARQLANDLGPKRSMLKKYRASAKRRGKEFLLTEKEFVFLISQNCVYCGAEPSEGNAGYTRKHSQRTFKHNGVDRVDNSIGYTSENSVSCCGICNQSKHTLTLGEWKDWVQRVNRKMFND